MKGCVQNGYRRVRVLLMVVRSDVDWWQERINLKSFIVVLVDTLISLTYKRIFWDWQINVYTTPKEVWPSTLEKIWSFWNASSQYSMTKHFLLTTQLHLAQEHKKVTNKHVNNLFVKKLNTNIKNQTSITTACKNTTKWSIDANKTSTTTFTPWLKINNNRDLLNS